MAVTPGYAGGLNPVFSPRRKVRKGVWGKNQINIEVLCGLCASARDKNKYNLAEAQSTQRFLG
jgi:hypothetical protein